MAVELRPSFPAPTPQMSCKAMDARYLVQAELGRFLTASIRGQCRCGYPRLVCR
jgi:hypothetical protein